MVKCPFRLNAIPPFNAIVDGTCVADGETDDSAHLAADMASALSVGKRLYLPAGSGSYLLNSAVSPPSGLYMYGDGATTIIEAPNNPASATNIFTVHGKTNLTFRDMAITGDASQTDETLRLRAFEIEDSSNLLFQNLDFDKMYYIIKLQQGSGYSAAVTISGCTTTTDVINPIITGYVNGVYIDGCDLSAWYDTTISPMSHHLYISAESHDIYVTDLTCRYGQSCTIQTESEAVNISNVNLDGITLDEIEWGIYIKNTTGATIENVTGDTSRWKAGGYPWTWNNNSTGVLWKDCAFSGGTGALSFNTSCGAGEVVYGAAEHPVTIVDCEDYLPDGCLVASGSAPTYTNVTVNGTPISNPS